MPLVVQLESPSYQIHIHLLFVNNRYKCSCCWCVSSFHPSANSNPPDPRLHQKQTCEHLTIKYKLTCWNVLKSTAWHFKFCTAVCGSDSVSFRSDGTVQKCVFTVERQDLLLSMCHLNKLCSVSSVCQQISPAMESQLLTDRDLIPSFRPRFRSLPSWQAD